MAKVNEKERIAALELKLKQLKVAQQAQGSAGAQCRGAANAP